MNSPLLCQIQKPRLNHNRWFRESANLESFFLFRFRDIPREG